MFKVKKVDNDRQICFGEVYAPNLIDTHGAVMRAEDIELMAHRFMRLQLSKSIDTMHDNEPVDVLPIESFIACADHPEGYTEGAWVLGVKVEDEELWKSIKKGELNGYSFEAWVTLRDAVAIVEVTPEKIGETEENDGHTHLFFAELDDDGRVVNGRTSTTNGHSHEIKKATVTEEAEGHAHRFFI